jgi:GAF domain-containing protein
VTNGDGVSASAGVRGGGSQRRRPPAQPPAGEAYGPEFLYQIIEVISSGPDLHTILHGFVPLVTAATECHGCFIYFVEDGKLVMRAASAGYSHLEGKVRLGLEEGLTGWVARTRRSAFIKDRALEDPRVVYVPELEEERYQSLVAVPIVSRAGLAIGVITLHARAPHEFRRQDLTFLEHSAFLIAGAIENARLYEEAVATVGQLTRLSALAQQVAAAADTEELLRVVTEGCRELLGASRCDLYLAGPGDQLEPAAASPARREAPGLDAGRLWSQLVDADTQDEVARGLGELVWGHTQSGSPLFAVLSAGEERVGLLCVLVDHAAAENRRLLASVASHTAVAIRRRQLIDSLEEQNLVKDFFEALAGGGADPHWLRGQAAKLHCDLDAQHLVLMATPFTPPPRPRARTKGAGDEPADWHHQAGRLEARLRIELPGSIFDQREGLLRALLRVPPAGVDAVVDRARRAAEAAASGPRGGLVIGLSNPCQGEAAIVRGFEEAGSAAQVGSLLRGGAGVFAYEELGAYRYVLSAEGSVHDRYQDRLQKLVEHQKRRGTELLGTLEAFLENLGSISGTARALHMHPNTLRQRLARIAKLTELDLSREDWLSLGMAIKVVKLRGIRAPQTGHLSDQ